MGSNKDKVIRFSVGSHDSGYSSIWRIWFNKPSIEATSNVYISYRSLGGTQKISIHQSGDIQYSFTSEYAKKMDKRNSSRHIDKWNISLNRPIFKIIVPDTELKKVDSIDNEIKLVPPPSKDCAIELYLYITTKSIFNIMPKEFNMFEENTLSNGNVLSILWRDNPITDNNKNLYLSHKNMLRQIIKKDSIEGDDLRGFLFLNNNGNERGFIDIAL